MRNLTPDKDPQDPAYYEGLVFATAKLVSPVRGMELEDVQQVLRLKVWTALGQYNKDRSRMTVRAFVYACVRNQAKDLMKRNYVSTPTLTPMFIEDLCSPNGVSGDVARERFENRYLAERGSYEEVEGEPLPLPADLGADEKTVTLMLFLDYSREEIATECGLSKHRVDVLVKSIRMKMQPLLERAA